MNYRLCVLQPPTAATHSLCFLTQSGLIYSACRGEKLNEFSQGISAIFVCSHFPCELDATFAPITPAQNATSLASRMAKASSHALSVVIARASIWTRRSLAHCFSDFLSVSANEVLLANICRRMRHKSNFRCGKIVFVHVLLDSIP